MPLPRLAYQEQVMGLVASPLGVPSPEQQSVVAKAFAPPGAQLRGAAAAMGARVGGATAEMACIGGAFGSGAGPNLLWVPAWIKKPSSLPATPCPAIIMARATHLLQIVEPLILHARAVWRAHARFHLHVARGGILRLSAECYATRPSAPTVGGGRQSGSPASQQPH